MAISVLRFWAWPYLEPFEATGLLGPYAAALISISGSKVRMKAATDFALASESFLLSPMLPFESVKPLTTSLVNPWVSITRATDRISFFCADDRIDDPSAKFTLRAGIGLVATYGITTGVEIVLSLPKAAIVTTDFGPIN